MNIYAITIDLDWAPDFAIDFVAQALIDNHLKATWFITHDSPQIKVLRRHKELFELGIHPNFLKGSSHGPDDQAVLAHMMSLVPEARSVRTHALVQSTPLLYKFASEFGIKVDVSLFLPDTPNLQPHTLHLFDQQLVRVPYFWEDDVEAYNPAKCWDVAGSRYRVSGLKIFNFHPMYTYLNLRKMDGYKRLKKIRHLPELTPSDCAPFIEEREEGTCTLFRGLIEHIKEKQRKSYTISDIAANADRHREVIRTL